MPAVGGAPLIVDRHHMQINLQLAALVAVVFLFSGCRSVYSIKVSNANPTFTEPVVEARATLDAVMVERGFRNVQVLDYRLKERGIVKEWQKVYKQDFMWGVASFMWTSVMIRKQS
jgi:hypothetical protein